MTLSVRLRATYSTVEWTEGSDDPIEGGGYTSVGNPWSDFYDAECYGAVGGPDVPLKADQVERDALWAEWYDEYVETITVDLWTAAEMVLAFPGGVWDYFEGNGAELQGDGTYRDVTLHVVDHAETVFALADLIDGKVMA